MSIPRLRWPRGLDVPATFIGVAMVLAGSVTGARSSVVDVDEVVYRSTIARMQHGASYYEAAAAALTEKSGSGPSQVRSVRTPVLSVMLSPFPAWSWRWLAAVPALLLCLMAALLAGPDAVAQRLAAGFAGLWMVVSLPLLYLHAELWGAPVLLASALLLRSGRDRHGAALALVASGVRELFGVSLLVGLVLRSKRRPWITALALAGAGAALHAHWTKRILDPTGYEPPLVALDPYARYLSPGAGMAAQVLGVVMLGMALAGWWVRRRDEAFQYLAAACLPMIVATALFGRTYWSLTWCGASSAAAAVALAAAVGDRGGTATGDRERSPVPYPQM